MKRASLVMTVAFTLVIAASSLSMAQRNRQELNTCLGELIQRRVQSQQAAQLSAQTITLTGDTLRLSGRAWIRFSDISISADEDPSIGPRNTSSWSEA